MPCREFEKGYSFHLLSILIALLTNNLRLVTCIGTELLDTDATANNSPYINTECAALCDQHRPRTNFHKAYILDCGSANFSSKEKALCKLGCESCSEDVCDPTQEPVLINCPKTIEIKGDCKRRCDYQRPEGNWDEYTFTCNNQSLFKTGWDIRQCSNDCNNCPEYVCNYEDLEFNCPSVNPDKYARPSAPPSEPMYDGSVCEWRCDKHRPPQKSKELSDEYELVCFDKQTWSAGEIAACNSDCATCPLHVCDYQENFGVFKCPESKEPELDLPKPRVHTFIVSWIVIGFIAILVIGCIIAASLYGRTGGDIIFRHGILEDASRDEVCSQESLKD